MCKTRELLRYITVGLSAYTITGIGFGMFDVVQSATLAGLLYSIAMAWVFIHYTDYTSERKFAFAIFLTAGFVLLKQVAEIHLFGEVTRDHLWWVVDVLVALFALLIAVADSKFKKHEND
jgi:hypothetical protein